jgi:hypothetical protein
LGNLAYMDDHIKTLKYPWTIDITVIRARSYRVNIYMEFEMAGK